MTELENLEQKVAQLVALRKQVKEENRDLRVRTTEIEAQNKQLGARVTAARERIDALLARIPDVPEET